MVKKKTLAFSFLLALFVSAYINTYNEIRFPGVGEAGINALTPLTGNEIVSFAFGNFVLYLAITGVIYLFLRSIVKSFEGPTQ